MADDMNRVPEAHFRKLMQEAKDAAMADGELDDTLAWLKAHAEAGDEEEALEDETSPSARLVG